MNAPRKWLLLVVLLAAAPARAQADEQAAPTPSASPEQPSALELAHQHFQHGVELAGSGDYEPALVEFLTAYRTFPNFVVLYNIAQAYILLGRPIEAVETLERYLRDGGPQIVPARVERTVEQIAAQRTQVAELRVAVSVAGAAIEIDGRSVGSSPLVAPLQVDPGTHLLAVRTPDRPALLRSVTLSAGQTLELAIELPRPVPTLAPPPALAEASERAAPSLRVLSYALGAAGVALGASALGHYAWNRQRYSRWQSEHTALEAERVAGSYAQRQQANNQLSASIERAQPVTWVLALSSAACLASGALLFAVAGAGTVDATTTASPSGLQLSLGGAW